MTLCINPRCQKPQNSDNTQFCQNCGSSLLLKQRYRAMKVLGGGGFGKTYEASDLGKQTKVIKVLINNSPKAVELFQREAEVLSQLNNPGIPKVEPNSYIVFRPANSQEPVHCLVMEKIEGMNLRDYVKRLGHPIDFDTAKRWLQELVTILQAVHDRGILHRDIKPQNIIFKPDGRLALIDFGAVREGTGTEFASTTGSGSGTEVASHMAGGTSVVSRGYTPPEQMNGEALKQSDFYSLGRTFVFLLTGKEPSEIPYDAHDDVLQWRKYAANVESKLAQLLDQMQSTLVRQRPKSTEEIMQSLRSSSTSKQPNPTPQSPIRGEDIEVPLEISKNEAIYGASKIVSFMRFYNIVNGKQRTETKEITVSIPQGAKDGQRLRLKEQGHAGKYGGDAGDAYVLIKIRESSNANQRDDSKLPMPEQPKAAKRKKTWFLVTSILVGVAAAATLVGVVISSQNNRYRYDPYGGSYRSPTPDPTPLSKPIGYPKAQCGTGAGYPLSVLYTEENFNKISQDFCLDVASFKRVVNSQDGQPILQVASFRTQQEAADFEQVLTPYFPAGQIYRLRN